MRSAGSIEPLTLSFQQSAGPAQRDDFSLSASSVTGSCSVTLKEQTPPRGCGERRCAAALLFQGSTLVLVLVILSSPGLSQVAFCADVEVMDLLVVDADSNSHDAPGCISQSDEADLQSKQPITGCLHRRSASTDWLKSIFWLL